MASPVEKGESSNGIPDLDSASAVPSAGAIAAALNEMPSVPTHNYVATDNNIVLDTGKSSPNQWQTTRHEAMKALGPAAVWNAMALPCITYGKTQYELQRIKRARENPEDALVPYKKINGPCVEYGILATLPPPGILAVKETNRIRGEYDIEPRKNKNPKSIFCPHCTVLRDQLEVSQRENERGAGVVKQQPPLSPPMQEISPRPEATSPLIDPIPDKVKKPKKKGKAADIIEHASQLLHPAEMLQRHPDALNHLRRPLSRILERKSEATQDSHLTGSPAEAIGMPPVPTLDVGITLDEELPSRLPTPLPHGLHEAELIPDEPLPQPALSPRMMPMDEIIVRIRTPSPSPSRSRERRVPPARTNSPIQGFHPHQHSPLRNRSPGPGRIGPSLLPHEVHTGAANALSVDDPLSRKPHHRAHSPHRLYDDWVEDSEVTPGLGPGSHNLEIDITLPTYVTPLANHVREDQVLAGRGRSRSPPEMIVELPPGASEPGTPKTGDVRQTPKFVPIHEGHKPTIIDINRHASPPRSPPMPGTENTGVVGAPPSTILRQPEANNRAAEEEVRRPIGIPKTVTAPHMGAGSARTNHFGGLFGRSQSSGDGAGSRPNTPPQSRIPVPVFRQPPSRESRQHRRGPAPSRKGSPAWDKPTIVEHAKRMGSYQLMMRDDGTGRLSGLEI